MRRNSVLAFLLFWHLGISWIHAQDQVVVDRPAFYKAMASDNLEAVNTELVQLKNLNFLGKEAFVGTLLMKRSGLISGPNKKLNMFKTGRRKLETTISKDSLNAEYLFFRLMIQEHAPGIVGYNKDLNHDHRIIVKYFKSLQQDVQDAIRDYSKKSKILKPADF
jgi:hypothetical protein